MASGRDQVLKRGDKDHLSRGMQAIARYLDPYIGNLPLESVHMGTLQQFIMERTPGGGREPKDGKEGPSTCALQMVRHILNLAAGEWMDEHGMTWLTTAPKIKLLREDDKKEPYPLSWEEQMRLFN